MRLDDEQAALSRRTAAYGRDREQLSAAEEEEHTRALEEGAFRIAILTKRLRRHEEAALSQYYELDRRLRGDGRLAALLTPV